MPTIAGYSRTGNVFIAGNAPQKSMIAPVPESLQYRTLSAFSIVEVTLALGITAFCLLVLLALIPVGISTQKDASEETASMNLASAILADLQAAESGVTERYRLTFPSPATGSQSALYLNDAGEKVANASEAHYLAIVSLVSPALDRPAPTYVHVSISWPAVMNGSMPNDPVAFDPNAATYPNTTPLGMLKPAGGIYETFCALDDSH